MPAPASPPPGRIVRLLKSGYWDATELLEMPDGSRRVRKHNKTDGSSAGPWGIESLRREIHYLQGLDPTAARHFPPVLAAWDSLDGIGYDMPFYCDHRDAGALAANAASLLAQTEIDHFQTLLAAAVLQDLHQPAPSPSPLSRHFDHIVREALAGLRADPALRSLIDSPTITLNGETVAGTLTAWERITGATDLLARLDASPAVRLHGDFFLENLLWCPTTACAQPVAETCPQLLLIDPVSVAGISLGPALFDVVKYVSYASGELLALRSEWVHVEGVTSGGTTFTYAIDWAAPGLQPFRTRDWYRTFRAAFVARHGEPDRALYALIDGYFSAAMALNTSGLQRQARLLKATREFQRALEETPA